MNSFPISLTNAFNGIMNFIGHFVSIHRIKFDHGQKAKKEVIKKNIKAKQREKFAKSKNFIKLV